MKKFTVYFKLELKRMLKAVPVLIAGMIIFTGLICGLAVISSTVQSEQIKEFNIIKVGITGAQDDKYTNLIFQIVENMDTVQYSCQFDYCTPDEAESGLKDGTYDAIFIIPEDYVESFMHGKNQTVTIRFGTRQSGIGAYVVKQFSDVVKNLIIVTETDIYTMQDYYQAKGTKADYDTILAINMEYFDKILSRSSIFSTDEVDVNEGMSTVVYYFCDAIVLVFLFIGLQFSKLLQKNSFIIERKMNINGIGALKQITGRFMALITAYLIMYILFAVVVCVGVSAANQTYTFMAASGFELFINLLKGSLILIPACVLTMFVYEIFDEHANGVLFLFVIILALGFVSGCFYPLSFLPKAVQAISNFTVTRAMFCYVSRCITWSFSYKWMIVILIHSAILYAAAVLIRNIRIKRY